MKKMKKNTGKVVIEFTINVTEIRNGQTVVNNHMDGKVNVEVEEVREVIRTSVASAVKGIADSLENHEEKPWYEDGDDSDEGVDEDLLDKR